MEGQVEQFVRGRVDPMRVLEDHQHRPLPVTEHLTRRSIILPLHHELTAAEQELVVETLAKALVR